MHEDRRADPAAEPGAPQSAHGHPDATEGDLPDELAEPAARNPFRLALLLGGVAMVALAALTLWQRVSAVVEYRDERDPWQLFGSALTDAALEPLLTGGLFAIVLWLVLGALRRRG